MEKEERKSRTARLRRIELTVWSIILIILLAVGIFIWVKHEESFETHTIYMPDVDGLIVGSPVHMMGIPIGYVNKVKIIGENEIKVRFKVTQRSVHIPAGTFATVEFSGLGGSKSLEIYTRSSGKIPNEIVGKNDYIVVDRPKRLRDSMALLYQMYKTLMDMIYTTANFGNKVKDMDLTELQKGNINDFGKFLDYTDNYLDNYNRNMKSIRGMLFKGKYSR